jgi:hypothetical protein
MVPWGWNAAKTAGTAAEDLQRALLSEGAKDVKVTPLAGGSAVRVAASFGAGFMGSVTDRAEFVLSGSTHIAAFRAASSAGGTWPLSNDQTVLKRNRDRMLRIRGRLFAKYGWQCACPPDLDPFAAAKCALSCDR